MTNKIKIKKNKTIKCKIKKEPFVVIGGVGGSGTRLIAMILSGLGLNIGSNLNEPLDNNTFVYLFRRVQTLEVMKDKKLFNIYLNILRKSICEGKLTKKEIEIIDALSKIKNQGVSYKWLEEQSNIIKDNVKTGIDKLNDICEKYDLEQPLEGKWGWKAPNSHVIMKELHEVYPNMKYIMVVRNGLDMAYSDNQGQLALWGPTIFKDLKPGWKKSPKLSLKYWRIVHERILKDSKELGKNFLWLDYDDLCINPDKNLPILFDFLKIPREYIESVKPMIKISSGIGRFKEYKNEFDKEDVEFVKKLGYDIF